MAGRPLLFTNSNELQEKIDAYFLYCDSYKKKDLKLAKTENQDTGEIEDLWQEYEIYAPLRYSLSGLAAFLDCDRGTIANYEAKDEFFSTVDRARTKILAQMEQNLLSNNGSAAGHMFVLKNFGGGSFVDKTEVVNINKTLGDELDELEKQKNNQQLNESRPAATIEDVEDGASL